MIPFIIVYAVLLCVYFYTRTSGNVKARAINKYIMATMYMVYAIIQFQNYEFLSHHLIFILALFFAFLGDIFLVFDLNRGGDFFLCGNVCFAVYYMTVFADKGYVFGDYYWVLIAWAAMLLLFIFFSNKFPNVFKMGKMKWPMTFYLSSIMLHGMFGLGAMILNPSLPVFILGLGSLMFMISDLILTVDKFVVTGTKWIVRCNSFFYFIGLLLIALSIGL